MKVLHLADIHIDSTFSCSNDKLKREIRSVKFNMLKKIVEFVDEYSVDIVIVAGDLFDLENPSARIKYNVNKWFKELLDTGAYVVYASGNHDFWFACEIEQSVLKNKRFIGFLDSKVEKRSVELSDEIVIINGVGYSERNPNIKVITDFEPKNNNKIHIGVCHGVIEGSYAADIAPYYPMSRAEIAALRYDYFALGHVHKPAEILENCNFSGGFFKRHYKDFASYGGLLIEFKNGLIDKKDIKFTNTRVENIALSVAAKSYEELLSDCLNAFEEYEKKYIDAKNTSDAVYYVDNSSDIDKGLKLYNIEVKGEVGFVFDSNIEQKLSGDIFLDDNEFQSVKFGAVYNPLLGEIKDEERELSEAIISAVDESYEAVLSYLEMKMNGPKKDKKDISCSEDSPDIYQTGIKVDNLKYSGLRPISVALADYSENIDEIKNLIYSYI